VVIDEAHFFGAALTPVCIELIRRGVRVIVAGVERDHLGRPFEPFPSLLCEADEVVKLSGRCAVCGGPSVHSQRLIASDAHIVVGGAESYQPRCRACFNPAEAITPPRA
jgi:thymidine kinase